MAGPASVGWLGRGTAGTLPIGLGVGRPTLAAVGFSSLAWHVAAAIVAGPPSLPLGDLAKTRKTVNEVTRVDHGADPSDALGGPVRRPTAPSACPTATPSPPATPSVSWTREWRSHVARNGCEQAVRRGASVSWCSRARSRRRSGIGGLPSAPPDSSEPSQHAPPLPVARTTRLGPSARRRAEAPGELSAGAGRAAS